MLEIKRFTLSILALLFVFVIMTVGAGSIYGSEEQMKLTYKVTIDSDEQGHVEAVLEGINRATVEFRMPTVDQTDLKNNITDFSAAGADGNSLPVSSGSRGWTVSPGNNDTITISYNFGLQFSQTSGRDWNFVNIGETYGLFYNEAVYAFPEVELTEVFVEFELPDHWGVGTHFLELGNNRFQVEGRPGFKQELLYNTTRVGVIEHQVTKEYDDLTLSFFVFQVPQPNYGLTEFWRSHYETTPEEEMELYLDKTHEAIQRLTDIFGYWPGGNSYIVTSRSEGDDLHSLTGFNYWVPSWTRERQPDMHHHVTHAWIWRNQLAINDIDNWLEEGIPIYYQAELPYRMENDDMWLGLHYLHHLVVERAEQHQLMDKFTIYYYAQNHMRALALDREIRSASDGASNIDTLMNYIGREYGLNSPRMTHSQMISAINHVAGEDLGDFYNRHMSGIIAREMPPVENFIDEYEKPFLKWLDTYAATPGYVSGESRTMLLIALEMGIHHPEGHETEHSIAGRTNPYMLREFRKAISGNQTPFTEDVVIEALNSITGVDQSDFFEFYTVGEYRPSVDEVTHWYENPPQEERPYAHARDDLSAAYIEPNEITIGVPTEIKLVVNDEKLVSDQGHVRVSVELKSDENLGTVLEGLDDYIVVDNLEANGVTKNFEAGLVQGHQIGSRWEGTFVVTLPDNFRNMQIQADHEADHHHRLAISRRTPVPDIEEVTDAGVSLEEDGDKESAGFLPYLAAGILLPVAGIGIYLAWKRKNIR